MSNRVITVKRGQEYQTKVESIYDKDAFFYDAYHQAAVCLEDILASNADYQSRTKPAHSGGCESLGGKDSHTTQTLLGYPSNVIAFCADRGQGKTSAMVSFSKALSELPKAPFGEKETDIDAFWGEDRQARKCSYVVLPSIDPSAMEDGESILKIILSRMFKCLKSPKSNCCHGNYELPPDEVERRRNSLLGQFYKCVHNLDVLRQGAATENEDELEQIMELADSSNLRGMLYSLICGFLEFVSNEAAPYLVLQIDDADLNVRDAYKIIDDLRRYMVLPRVIILMAVNMEQLESVVEQHFLVQYGRSIDVGGGVDVQRCHRIAERYLEKVIPSFRQIYLPDIAKEIGNSLNPVHIKYMDGDTDILPDEGLTFYQERLLSFLSYRTGMIFLDSTAFLHNLLPRTMRELTNFLVYFSNMPKLELNYWDLADMYADEKSFEDNKGKLDGWLKSLSRLETYLVEFWAPLNLSANEQKFLALLRMTPNGNKHRTVLWHLPDYYARERCIAGPVKDQSSKMLGSYRDQFVAACKERGADVYDSEILENDTKAENAGKGKLKNDVSVSYADVYTALTVLTSLPDGNNHYKFAYAIRACYAITLHRLLLEQIRSYGIQDEDTRKLQSQASSISAFLADVLYKREELAGDPAGLIYSHYLVNVDRFKQAQPGKAMDRAKRAMLERFCQQRISGTHAYALKKITQDSEPLPPVYFNFFYPLLWGIEEFADSRWRRSDSASPVTEDVKNELVTAAVVLLNPDVQYALESNLRELMQGRPGTRLSLSELLGMNLSNKLQFVLERIYALSDLDIGRGTLFYKYGGVAFDADTEHLDLDSRQAITLLELSTQTLREAALRRYDEIFEGLKTIKQEITAVKKKGTGTPSIPDLLKRALENHSPMARTILEADRNIPNLLPLLELYEIESPVRESGFLLTLSGKDFEQLHDSVKAHLDEEKGVKPKKRAASKPSQSKSKAPVPANKLKKRID